MHRSCRPPRCRQRRTNPSKQGQNGRIERRLRWARGRELVMTTAPFARCTHMSFFSSPLIAAGLSLALLCAGSARAAPRVVRDVKFARAGDSDLLLDLYLPSGSQRPIGLIVWVHGGAWRAGSRASVDLLGLTDRGWAVASVDYRLSTVARFPAQVHDIKAAIRYLRARASEHGYPPERLVIAGSSAGGHLAALVGVSNRHPELEGSIGTDTRTSSDVQAIVSLYGASNLTSILAQSTPHGLSVR